MKKLIILIAFVLTTGSAINAQKIVYVDTEKVLSSMSEYKEAQKEIDKITEKWQKEVQQKYAEIEEMYKAYQAEEILLTDDMKRKKEDEILNKEKAMKDFQKEKFGFEGALYKKRQELVKPVQDKIYEAIEKMAQQKAYDFVLDKSSGVSILFANEKYDKTAEIMDDLGIINK